MSTSPGLTAEERRQGWILLFNGRNTERWHTYGASGAGAAWKVADGALYLDAANKSQWAPGDGGDLVTDASFENFHLKLDWKVAPGGNSGVIFHVAEEPQRFAYSWQSGIEVQVLDNERHPDAKIERHRAGDLYDLIAAKEAVKPAGEWNHLEILVSNNTIDVDLNGERVVHSALWDANWERLIGASKFRDYPGFGRFRRGRIALQDHGDQVWYRNVRIRPL